MFAGDPSLPLEYIFLSEVLSGNEQGLKKLIQKAQGLNITNAVINFQDEIGQTPLILASAKGYLSMVKKLIERGARVDASQKDGTNAAYVAAQNGHFDVLKLLIQNHSNLINLKGYKGQLPLFPAASNGHLDIVKYLTSLSNKSIHIQDNDGQTPFIAAAKNGHSDVAEYLLSAQWNVTLSRGKFLRINLRIIFHGKNLMLTLKISHIQFSYRIKNN